MAEQKNVALFYGNDEYLVGTHARERVDAVCPDSEKPLALEVIDGTASKIDDAAAAIDGCLAAFRTVGLFGGKKVVWFRDITFLSNAVIMKNAKIKQLLAELAGDIKQGLAADQFLIIAANGIDKRSAFYKAIKEAGDIVEFMISERDYEARPVALQRARELFKKNGFLMDSAALDLFIEKTGFDTRQIMNEAEKMMLFKGDDNTITSADVRIITSATGEALAWDFTDAIAERKLGTAIRLFRQLLFQKQSAIGLIIQIESMFHNLLRFREYIDEGWVRLAGSRTEWSNDAELDTYFEVMPDDPRKMHWFRTSKFVKHAMPYTARGLAARKQLVVDTHELMLSSGSIPHDLMLETLLAKLCAPAPRRR